MADSKDDDEYIQAIELMCRLSVERQQVKNGTWSVHAEDECGWTPLFSASASNNVDLIRLFIKLGANVNHQGSGNGWTALVNAAYWGNIEAAIELLAAGADPLLLTFDGLTAVDIATHMNRKKILLIFEKYFALKKAA